MPRFTKSGSSSRHVRKEPGRSKITAATKKQFAAATTALAEAGQHPPQSDPRGRTEFLIRRLLGAEPEIGLLIALKDWLEEEFPH